MIWPGLIHRNVNSDSITIPIQNFMIQAPDDFEEITKPPLWLSTFLKWHPVRYEGVWKSGNGSVWRPSI